MPVHHPAGVLAAAIAAALLAACGGDAPGPSGAGAAGAQAVRSAAAGSWSSDPRARELRDLVEAGSSAAARVLLEQVGDQLGVEGPLIAARIHLAEGDAFGALREAERARALAPRDPRPYAAAAETYASLGRIEAATAEYQRGLDSLGSSPELTRALGVIGISTPGGAQSGLAQLELARRQDPQLPFSARPLAEAHLILGRAALLQGTPSKASIHAHAGLELEPADGELRRLRGEALAAGGALEEAVLVFQELLVEGQPVAAELARFHHAAATAALVRGARPAAVNHYVRARELGHTELGFGATVLREEVEACLARGRGHYERAENLREGAAGADAAPELQQAREDALDAAQAEFLAALHLAPGDPQAADLLGGVHFRAGRYPEAARAWESVLGALRERGETPPYPVHMNAARAWRLAQRWDLARAVLESELERGPAGAFAQEARDMLARLIAEAELAAPQPSPR